MKCGADGGRLLNTGNTVPNPFTYGRGVTTNGDECSRVGHEISTCSKCATAFLESISGRAAPDAEEIVWAKKK